MNKTININLGGLFFHIDEVAFQKLEGYLDSISISLGDDSQGKDEIIADIEDRISELLSNKMADIRKVINEKDIDQVIKIMGQPEDYAEEGYTNKSYSYKIKKSSIKKLFRDGDDKFLGGVASGISHYSKIDATWVRLIFILLIFTGGFGIITYIILWFVVPEAETTADKLQMKGEPVNIGNIEKKIREEINSVTEAIKDGADEIVEKISNADYKKYKKKAKSGFQRFLDTLSTIILTFFDVICKFIGVIIMVCAAVILIALIIGVFLISSIKIIEFNHNFIAYPSFFYDSIIPVPLLTICLFILTVIPFLILFILGLRILSNNIKKFGKSTSLTLLGMWLIALFTLIFTVIEFSTTKAFSGYKIEKNELTFSANDTIKIKMIKDDNLHYQHNFIRNSGYVVIYQDETKKLYSTNIRVDVEKSEADKTYIKIRKKFKGRNRLNANKGAGEIEYNYNILEDTILLNSYFISSYKNILRNQDIYITVFVPEGVIVYFDKTARNYLTRIDNTTNTYDRKMVGHYFLMTKNGLDSKELRIKNSDF